METLNRYGDPVIIVSKSTSNSKPKNANTDSITHRYPSSVDRVSF